MVFADVLGQYNRDRVVELNQALVDQGMPGIDLDVLRSIAFGLSAGMSPGELHHSGTSLAPEYFSALKILVGIE